MQRPYTAEMIRKKGFWELNPPKDDRLLKHYVEEDEYRNDYYFYPADYAAIYGKLDYFVWIRENGGGWTRSAIEGAIRNDHFDVLEWIHKNEKEPYYFSQNHEYESDWDDEESYTWEYFATWGILRSSKIEDIEWYVQRGGKLEWNLGTEAAKHGETHILQYLKREGALNLSHHAADAAARNGHLETLKWLRDNYAPWTIEAVHGAERNKHVHILEWIVKQRCLYSVDAQFALENLAKVQNA